MSRYGHPLQLFSATWAARILTSCTLSGPSTFCRVSVIAVFLTVLANCASTPPEPDLTLPSPQKEDTLPVAVEGEELDLVAIEHVTSIAHSSSLMHARHERNRLSTSGIDASTLIAIDTRLAWLEGDVNKSTAMLNRLAQDNTASVDFVLRDQERYAETEGNWLEAAEILLAQIARSPERRVEEHTGERLFAYLIRADEERMRARLRTTSDAQWRAWLEMHLAYRQGGAELERWRSASSRSLTPALPHHLAFVSDDYSVEHVALLLPLQGALAPAGEAVVAGAMDQLYSLFPDPSRRPVLTAIDTQQYPDIASGYRAAIQQGSDMVIGPLTKANVAALADAPNKPVPLITLNQIDGFAADSETPWLSFSLSPEDEARQTADVAFGQGCRNAIVVAMSSERGQRLLGAFETRWQRHGGALRGRLMVDDPNMANEPMGKLLGSGSSDQRIRDVERAFDLPVDSRGRGRTDFECIFMLAPDPATARTWRPLLVFHMTGDIPVYATSAINDGMTDTRNRDLNGVRFVETPAMLPPLSGGRLGRLKALGGDALLLAQRWQQLQHTEQWVIRGQTGVLRRRADGSIERALELSTFDGAEVRRWSLK